LWLCRIYTLPNKGSVVELDLKEYTLQQLSITESKILCMMFSAYHNPSEMAIAHGERQAYTNVLLELNDMQNNDEEEAEEFIYKLVEECVQGGFKVGIENLDDALEREFITKDYSQLRIYS